MDDNELDQFQNFIDDFLIRNKSILDQMSKLQDACGHLSRNISKSVTTCGCLKINASKQPYPINEDISIEELRYIMRTHVEGNLCPSCTDLVEKEMGRILFYLAAISNTLGISLSSVLENEKNRTNLLGKYSLK